MGSGGSAVVSISDPAMKGVTFNVEKAKELDKVDFTGSPYSKFLPKDNEDRSLMKIGPKPVIESYGDVKTKVVQHRGHGFSATVFKALTNHYNLALKPDHLWQAVLEGFSMHVKNHAEELRSKFVAFEGKKQIVVQRDNFVLDEAPEGSFANTKNDWAGFVSEVVEGISEYVPKNVLDVVVTDFSTSSSIERVARHASLMAATSEYFEFICMTKCGIPSITLLGEKKDWVNLRARIEALANFMTPEFSKLWTPLLLEIVDQCLNVFDEKVDNLFWKSICKFNSTKGSGGGTFVSGWINNFFPYTDREGSTSPYLCSWNDLKSKGSNKEYGRRVDAFHDTFCEAPVTWSYLGKGIPMTLKAGFIGPVLLNEQTLMPQITWVLVR